MAAVFCPNCFAKFETEPDYCECGYPFVGNEMDKYKFMAEKNKKKKITQESIKIASTSRKILFVIGVVNLLLSIVEILSSDDNSVHFITLVYSVLVIGLSFYSYYEPFTALFVGFLIMLSMYAIIGFFDPMNLMRSFPFKIAFLVSFIYGLVRVKQAERLTKNED